MYDYLIVGSGLFGSVFAHEARKAGKNCLVLEKRGHIGGNIYTYEQDGINIHKYGAHVFHTQRRDVWNYIRQFADFNDFINTPLANYNGEIYHLPFNMNTFKEMWGVETPEEAMKIIEEQGKEVRVIEDIEDQAISLVGKDIYNKLIKGYTEKQWGRDCRTIPADLIKRVPVRFEYNNSYYNDRFQGIPVGGYTKIIEKLLEGTEVLLNTDFNAKENREKYENLAEKVIYTGPIDEYFNYSLGHLQYRSIRFEVEKLDQKQFQPVAIINYTSKQDPYIRIIEHKHFEKTESPITWISKEYPVDYSVTGEPYNPINDERNNTLYRRYKRLADRNPKLIVGGRLGLYQFMDMDKTILEALNLVAIEL